MRWIIAFALCLVSVGIANAQLKPPTESVMDRFLRYVKIDTQSQEDQTTTPSTRKQLNLANLLAKELTALGAENVRVSEFGIVYATVPGNLADNSKVPVVGFIAHMDTSPAVSGENVNAIIHKNYLNRFPHDMLPETTEGRVGFVHPYAGVIDVESSNLKILLRDFDVSGLDAKEKLLRDMVTQTAAKYPEVKITIDVKENYKNMKEVLKNYPELTANAMEAAKRAGLKPFLKPIRGGTDGSNLTFRGLPTPNLFTGGANFHGKLEFNSRKGLEKSTETLVNLVQIFTEKS